MRFYAFFLLLVSMLVSSCADGLTAYDFERAATFQIRAGLGPSTVHQFQIEDLSTDYADIAEANNFTPEQTADLYMRFCALELLSPLSRDLNFLQSGEIYINAPGNPEIKVADLTTSSSSLGQYVEFVPTTEPVVNHFLAEAYSLRLELVFDELVTLDREVRLLQSFRVLAE